MKGKIEILKMSLRGYTARIILKNVIERKQQRYKQEPFINE